MVAAGFAGAVGPPGLAGVVAVGPAGFGAGGGPTVAGVKVGRSGGKVAVGPARVGAAVGAAGFAGTAVAAGRGTAVGNVAKVASSTRN